MLRATVDSPSLHRMRHTISRGVWRNRLFTPDHFLNVFAYPLQGKPQVQGSGRRIIPLFLINHLPFSRFFSSLSDAMYRWRAPQTLLCTRLSAELRRPETLAHFMEALSRRLPPGGPPAQHLEDALILALSHAPSRRAVSDGATAALRVGEALYDAVFCATYAYYFEIIGKDPLAMAYAQAYAETISGIALGRKLDETETYRPILGGGGYYEYLEARQNHWNELADTLAPAVHFAPLRLLGGSAEESSP